MYSLPPSESAFKTDLSRYIFTSDLGCVFYFAGLCPQIASHPNGCFFLFFVELTHNIKHMFTICSIYIYIYIYDIIM